MCFPWLLWVHKPSMNNINSAGVAIQSSSHTNCLQIDHRTKQLAPGNNAPRGPPCKYFMTSSSGVLELLQACQLVCRLGICSQSQGLTRKGGESKTIRTTSETELGCRLSCSHVRSFVVYLWRHASRDHNISSAVVHYGGGRWSNQARRWYVDCYSTFHAVTIITECQMNRRCSDRTSMADWLHVRVFPILII